MPDFRYKARDARGAAHAGTIQATSKPLAASQLRDRGWVIVGLDQFVAVSQRSSSLNLGQLLPPRSVNVELSLQQLAMMVRSGMTLLDSLSALIEQTGQRSLASAWQDVSARIQRGSGLSEAMKRHACFPEFVLRLIRVGEQTGNMEAVLTRAASTMQARRNSKESFVSATIYPTVVVLLAAAVTAYMVIYLIPRLEVYLQSLGREMPAMTQSLIQSSFWVRDNGVFLLLILLAAAIAGGVTFVSSEGRFWLDRGLLFLPLVGQLIRLSETSTMARSLSMMLKSGITLTEGLGTVERILTNRFLRHTVAQAREKIIRGSSFVDALNQRNTFTRMLGQMCAVGQQSGQLDAVLDEVARLHDAQLASLVKRLNAILTPAMTIVIGGIVGYVYIAFFIALVAAGS